MSDGTGIIPLRLIEEVVHRVGSLVPPEATTHFIRAQRELLLGLTALIEHNSRQGVAGPSRGRRSTRSGAAATRSRHPRRVTID